MAFHVHAILDELQRKKGKTMKNPTNDQDLGYLVLGVLFGTAVALIALDPIVSKVRRRVASSSDVKEYLRQSGEGAGSSIRAIQRHDKKLFRGEVRASV